MTTEKRLIEIVSKVTDLASKPLGIIGRTIKRTVTQGAADFASLVKSVVSVRTAITAMVGGFAAFKGGSVVTGIAAATDELAKLARGTGSTVPRLLTLQNAFALSNVEADRFKGLLAALTKGVGQALNDGSSKAAKAMGKLGLTLEDLRTSDPVELFDRLAGSLEKFTTPQEKAAAILEVFPKATGEIELMVDVLGQGQEAFRNLVATAQFFGGTIDEKGVAAVVRFNGALDVLQLSLQGIGRSATVVIAEKLAPLIERLATYFATNGKRIGEMIGVIAAALAQLVLQIGAAMLRLLAFLQSNGEKITEALEGIPIVGKMAADAIRKVFDTRDLTPNARKIRDEIAALADEHTKLGRRVEDLQGKLAEADQLPGEFSKNSLDRMNGWLRDATAERDELYRKMIDAQARFEAASGGSTGNVSGEADRQMQGAQLRAFAGDVAGLANFENLPQPPTNLAPIIKALFGADGIDGAKEKTRSFVDGVSDGLERVKEKWTDFGAAGEQAVTRLVDGGLDGLTDAFADIITGQKTAKEAFRDLAKLMLSELAKIIAKLIIMKALQASGLGGAAMETGGILPGRVEKTVPFRKFAMGGVVKRPTLALFGEGKASRGEAFVPLPDGRRIPVALSGGGGATMNITIQAMDGADVQRVLLNNRGTLRAVWQHDVSRVRSVRQNVKGASR